LRRRPTRQYAAQGDQPGTQSRTSHAAALVIQHKGDGQVHLILDNLLAIEAHLLFLHPRAANIAQPLDRPGQTLLDGILKAPSGSGADFLDFCSCPGHPPVICLSAESRLERTPRRRRPSPAIRIVRSAAMRPRPTIAHYKGTAKRVSVQYCSMVCSILLTTRGCGVFLSEGMQKSPFPGDLGVGRFTKKNVDTHKRCEAKSGWPRSAFQNVDRKNSFHQIRLRVVPGPAFPFLVCICGTGREAALVRDSHGEWVNRRYRICSEGQVRQKSTFIEMVQV